jgi:hypothetical protein
VGWLAGASIVGAGIEGATKLPSIMEARSSLPVDGEDAGLGADCASGLETACCGTGVGTGRDGGATEGAAGNKGPTLGAGAMDRFKLLALLRNASGSGARGGAGVFTGGSSATGVGAAVDGGGVSSGMVGG